MVVGKILQRVQAGMILLVFALFGLIEIGVSPVGTFAEKNLAGGNIQSDFQALKLKENSARLLIKRAYYELKWNGNSEKVRSYYMQALKYYQEIKNRLGEANALLGLGHVEMELGHTNNAKTFYNRALSISIEKRNQFGITEALLGLGHTEKKIGQYSEARNLYERALASSRQVGSRSREARVLLGLGDLARDYGKSNEATEFYAQSIDLYEKEGNSLGKTQVVHSVANLYGRLGQGDKARSLFRGVRRGYKEERDCRGEVKLLRDMAILERGLGNVLAAEAYAGWAQDHSRPDNSCANKSRYEIGKELVEKGDLYLNRGRPKEAKISFELARSFYLEAKNHFRVAGVLRKLGALEQELQNSRNAREFYWEAVLLYRQGEHPEEEAKVFLTLGDLENDLGRFNKAREFYNKALKIYREEKGNLGEKSARKRLDELKKK